MTENARVDQLAAEVRRQNELYESGQVDRAFWISQQDRLRAMKAADPKLTQRQIGELVGKDQRWVRQVLAWDGARAPFARDTPEGKGRGAVEARRVLRDHPEAVADEIADAVKRLPRDKRTEVGQAIFEQDRADYEADPDAQRAGKHADDRDHEHDARRQLGKAVEALAARLTFYSDVPLNDYEQSSIPVLRVCLERLEAGVAMDDELAAMLEGVE